MAQNDVGNYPVETVKWDKVPAENLEVIEKLFTDMVLVPEGVEVKKFYISSHEVQKDLWQALLGIEVTPTDSIVIDSLLTGEGDNNNIEPDTLKVDTASIDDIQRFISLLRKQTGKRFRLPTETERLWAANCGVIDTIADSVDLDGKGFHLVLDTIAKADPMVLVIITTDGTESRFVLNEMPQVKIEKPNLVVESEGTRVMFELNQMKRIRYEKVPVVPTAIEVVETNNSLDKKQGYIDFRNLPADANISIYTLDGRQVYSHRPTQGGTFSLPLNTLPSGVYLVKVNDVTYKVQKS